MLNSLQCGRGLAAILVVLFHSGGSIFALPKYFGHKPCGDLFDFGFAGVEFFFVLSGFIMMHVHANDFGQPRALASYLWKRFSRIYPVYWIVLAAVAPVYFFVPGFGLGHERDPMIILRSIFLLPCPENRMLLVVAWTLVHEAFFYLLFGLLILNQRLGVAVFLGWIAGIVVYPWFDGYLSAFLFGNLNLRFLAGIGVALILARWTVPVPRLLAVAGLCAILGTGMFEVYGATPSAMTLIFGYTLGSAVTLLGLVEAERSGLIEPSGWLVYLGNASYSIYLVHFPALSVIAKLAKAGQLDLYFPSGILFSLHVIGAIAAGCVFHELVEKPIHAFAKGCFRRTKQPAVALAEVKDVERKAA